MGRFLRPERFKSVGGVGPPLGEEITNAQQMPRLRRIGLIADQTHSLAKGVLIVPVAVLVAGVVFTYAAWRGERDDRRGTA